MGQTIESGRAWQLIAKHGVHRFEQYHEYETRVWMGRNQRLPTRREAVARYARYLRELQRSGVRTA